MENCSDCASLCCIAPSISKPDQWQGRISGEVIKSVNTRCEHLCATGECTIYKERSYDRIACELYSCKGFGPILTNYLQEHHLIRNDGTLEERGFILFCILNQMVARTFSGKRDEELSVTLAYYDEHKDFPPWLFSEEYWNYIFGRGIFMTNPRGANNIALPTKRLREKIRKIFRIIPLHEYGL